jgi:predicted ABC-type exoprotein transport system permease subunit
VFDAVRKQGDLSLRRTGVMLVLAVFRENLFLNVVCQIHNFLTAFNLLILPYNFRAAKIHFFPLPSPPRPNNLFFPPKVRFSAKGRRFFNY